MSTSPNLDVIVLSQCLTLAQKLAIKTSLLKLQIQDTGVDAASSGNIKQQPSAATYRFWGKITGTHSDYFIVVATQVSEKIQKKFYWSNDEGVTFAQLPTIDEFVSSKSPKIRGLFSGNPSQKYRDPEGKKKKADDAGDENEEEEEEVEEEEEEEPEEEEELDEEGNPIVKTPIRKLTELERLAYNIIDIESSTGLIPRGAYFLTATGQIQKNTSFSGLSVEEASQLTSYQLFRDAELPTTQASIRAMGVTNHHEFLDTIVQSSKQQSKQQSKQVGGEKKQPKDLWTLHASDSGLDVSIRSLLYPGFEYHLEAGSATNWTGAYFGLGEKNEDILFMI